MKKQMEGKRKREREREEETDGVSERGSKRFLQPPNSKRDVGGFCSYECVPTSFALADLLPCIFLSSCVCERQRERESVSSRSPECAPTPPPPSSPTALAAVWGSGCGSGKEME